MRLSALVQNDTAWPVDIAKISADVELARDIQGQLISAALLDPPIDGAFGPVSTWALGEFAAARKLSVADGMTRQLARALHAPEVPETFPLLLGDDLASKLVRALRRRGYWFSRHSKCVNIVYVEGMDLNGKPNGNKSNQFNDVRILLTLDATGGPTIVSWTATCEPGKFYTENPEEPEGAARIALGQFKAWTVGTHKKDTPGGHEALVQAAPITVCRDLNKDYQRDHDAQFVGMFGINQHWGYDLPQEDIGKASAGCLVGRSRGEHKEFMRLVKEDARYKCSSGYRFMTAILRAEAVDEPAFDPSTPH